MRLRAGLRGLRALCLAGLAMFAAVACGEAPPERAYQWVAVVSFPEPLPASTWVYAMVSCRTADYWALGRVQTEGTGSQRVKGRAHAAGPAEIDDCTLTAWADLDGNDHDKCFFLPNCRPDPHDPAQVQDVVLAAGLQPGLNTYELVLETP